MSQTQRTLLSILGIILITIAMFAIAKFRNTSSPKTMDTTASNTNTTATSTPAPTELPPDSIQTDPTSKYHFPGILSSEKISKKQATIKTKKGTIVFEFYPEDAPKTVSNFVYLTEEKYYNGLKFHRYEPGFVIQGGDPSGNGTGGPGYKFVDEKVTKQYTEGIVAMANAGPDTNGSQFFIMLGDTPLPPAYTIFGKVTKGLDVVQKIRAGDVMEKVTIESKT